jgi:hypothetical protein
MLQEGILDGPLWWTRLGRERHHPTTILAKDEPHLSNRQQATGFRLQEKDLLPVA